MTTTPAPPNPTEKVVYIGRIYQASDKKCYTALYALDAQGQLPADGDYRIYGSDLKLGRPGGIYTVEYPAQREGNTIYVKTFKYVGFWPDEALAIAWQTRHDAHTTLERLEKKRAKETGTNLVAEQLEPIREAYQKAVGLERSVILAQVVSYITRGH